jgi:hypothetical protein
MMKTTHGPMRPMQPIHPKPPRKPMFNPASNKPMTAGGVVDTDGNCYGSTGSSRSKIGLKTGR